MQVVFPRFSPASEIPGFLSEEECRVVVQLAQLKGLTESQTTTASSGGEQQEPGQPLLVLTTDEVFSLLDLNQDGLLQKQEVRRTHAHTHAHAHAGTHTHTHTQAHTHTCTHTHAQAHAHAHTHTHRIQREYRILESGP